MNRDEKSGTSKLKARLRYAFLYGVLWWSTFVIVATSLIDKYLEHRTLDRAYFQRKIPIFVVCGFIVGIISWPGNENRKKQNTEKAE